MSKRQKMKPGAIPGTILYTGHKIVDEVSITYTEYNDTYLRDEKYPNTDIKAIYEPNDKTVQWYNIMGLHDVRLIESIGKIFGIHPLILEDIADIRQRPKIEETQNGIFISIKSIGFNGVDKKTELRSISIFVGEGFVISFNENEDDLFKELRDRIINNQGRIRTRKADYLAYAIIDIIVDKYFIALDAIDAELEEIDDAINNQASENIKIPLHNIKKELMYARKSVSPLREVLFLLSKSDHPLVEERTIAYIRDVYDHTIQIMEIIESYRDIIAGLQELYISEISFKMNKIMQLLTIVTSIFVPLSFLTGLYGMNFVNIPELNNPYGYFILWGAMIALTLGLLYFFYRKKWL